MYTAHISALPFKEQGNHLRYYLSPYFRPISLEAGPEIHPEDADGTVTPVEGHWQGDAPPLDTQPQAFALVKVDLGTCYLFVSLDRLLHCHYVQMGEHEDSDIIGERWNLCSDTADWHDSTLGRTGPLIPEPSEQELQSKDIEKRG